MNLIKHLSAIILLMFLSTAIYSQAKVDSTKITDADFKKSVSVELKIHQVKHFEPFSMQLTSFSHKRPFTGGSTKATAYITISQGNVSEEITLSVYGIDGKSDKENGYETIVWKGYQFQLKSFNYDDSIGIIVTKQE
ncbi:MAG: hypothetical protein V4608_03520 [Bacteroidota bacterium]